MSSENATGQGWDEQRYLDYLKRLTADLRSTRRELADVRAREHEPIAIVGAGCRYPGGVTGPEELWDLVDAGGDAIGPFPPDRGWPQTDDPAAQGGFLHDAGHFDAGFFAMGPREALATDPQQRLILTVAWEALERAGIDPAGLRGSASGVFVGAATSGYGVGVAELPEGVEGHLLAGGATSVISGRTAYHLGWEGPVATVDTACSSSLVAMHLAVTALRRGECSLALAGGVAVMATPAMFAQFSAQQGLASDGRCKAFSDDADGTSWSEGAGVVLLERLSDAQAHGRHILGVIRGTAINADGASNGLTAPHGPSQQRVIRAALDDAGLGAGDVDAVDAHGTGTSLGDPIEAQALLATYGAPDRSSPMYLGALKSNLGHTQSAAGVGGVLKMLAAMAHGRLPRTLHADTPSAKVDWDEGAVELLTAPRPWPAVPGDDGATRPRRAAVSSFGISGTNAHVVLEAAPPGSERRAPSLDSSERRDPSLESDGEPGFRRGAPTDGSIDRTAPSLETGALETGAGPIAWPISARSTAALAGQARRLAEHLDPTTDPRAVAHALTTTRSAFEHRAVILGGTTDALLAGVRGLGQGQTPGDDVVTGSALRGRTAMLFPGQGSQYPAMGRGLAETNAVAAAAFDEIFAALDPHLERPLREVLFADPGTDPHSGNDTAALLDDTRWTQPALFAVEVATYRVWESWGVVPQALVGHSVGTIAAAHVAGVLSLDDAGALVAARARLMAELPPGGAMLAVAADEDTVRADLEGTGLDLAAVNGPAAVVVSGDAEAIDRLAVTYEDRGVRARRLRVSHAFHSARMEPALEGFRAVAARCTFAAPSVPIISDHTGEPATAAQLRDPEYWVAHLRHTVRFADAVATARRRGVVRFLEVGPGDALTTAARSVVDGDGDGDGRPVAAIGGVRRDDDPVRAMLVAAARLHVAGGSPSWAVITGGTPDEIPALPTYAFDEQRYWMTPTLAAPEPAVASGPTDWERRFWEAVERGDTEAVGSTLGTDHVADIVPLLATWHRERREADEVARLRYGVTWQPATLPESTTSGRWLAVDLTRPDVAPDDDPAVAALRGRGLEVTAVTDLEAAPDDVAGVLALTTSTEADDTGVALLARLAATVRALPEGTRLWVLTRGAVATGTRDPAPAADLAALWGAGRAVALERSAVWGGLVDLPDGDLDRRTTARLLAVLSGDGEEDQVALRGATVLARRLVAHLGPQTPAVRTPRGTVLITGGTGALGAAVARRAARRAVAAGQDLHLVLAGRRGPDAPGAPELAAELRGIGAEVTLVAVDTADREALAALVAEHPPSAVVHAAGVGDDTPLEGADAAAIGAVVTGKAAGAEHLDALTGDLDAFVLFSSISGVWGAGAQLAYAAANARLDALAQRRARAGKPATAVAWGPWSGAGMAADEAAEAHLRRRGLAGLDPDRALDALEQAITEGTPTTVVADVDWARFLAAYTLARPAPLFAALAPAEPAAPAATTATTAEPDSDLAHAVAGAGPAQALRTVLGAVRAAAAAVLGHASGDDVDPDRTFGELGVDSVGAVDLRDRVAAALGHPLPATAVFDHPTPRALAQVVLDQLVPSSGAADEPTRTATHQEDDPLVVVGMGCRFPGGVDDPEALWRLVDAGGDAIGPLPDDRGWDLRGLADAAGGFLDDVAGFDAGFFAISPREALAMDPQQRLVLETAWEAVERAGIAPSSLRGSRTGVFVGAGSSGYGVGTGLGEEVAGHVLTGTAGSVLSGRVAYVLGTEGPAVTVDTACSSSLVALHWAAAALRSGECDLALVGGVTVMATPFAFGEFSAQGGLAHDGRCKAFADDADGTGWSEGVAVVAVERLSAARAGGHPVLAVLRGSAVNSDGASNGLTAPNGPSQQRVIRAALADAGLDPADVDAVEAHGTGTTLGDPIEAQALLAVYGGERETPLRLGSVKSNLGHTQAAAGLSGLIKMIKALEHECLPATLHAATPSRHVDWASGSVALLREPAPWRQNGHPRRAGISSFGISGTNAHVVIEAAPEPEKILDDGSPEPAVTPWLVSGRTLEALADAADRLADAVASLDDPAAVTALAGAAARRRDAHELRAVVLAGLTDAVAGLRSITIDGAGPHVVTGGVVPGPTGLLLGGQGAQRLGMGAGLLAAADRPGPVDLDPFAAALETAAAAVDTHLGRDRALLDVVHGDPDDDRAADLLADTGWAQPALFAVQVAGGRLLEAWGCEPGVIVGHSVGEIAAAHLSGALSLDDAARLVAARADAMAALPSPDGAPMAAVSGDPGGLAALLDDLPDGVALAARNATTSIVLAGEPQALETLVGGLEDGFRVARLATSHAFHSPAMAPAADALAAVAADLTWAPPRVPVVSTHTGALVGPDTWADPAHWTGQLTAPVRFADAVAVAGAELGVGRWVEVGPHPTLTGHVAGDHPDAVVTCLGDARREAEADDPVSAALDGALRAAAVLWTAGDPLATWLPEPARVPAALPTTPFHHERFWPRAGRLPGGSAAALGLADPASGTHPLLAAAVRVAGRDEVVLTGVVSVTTQPWVADHLVPGATDPVLPGTALLDLVVRAGDETGTSRVEDLTLAAPLVVPAGGVRVQVAVEGADDDGRREVTVHSAPLGVEAWTAHATAVVAPETVAPEPVAALAVWPPAGASALVVAGTPADPDALYAGLADGGFAYGPTLRGLTGVWRDGDDLYVEARLPEAVADDSGAGHALHPALLDAVLHGLAAVDGLDDPGELPRGEGLPFSWAGVSVHAAGATSVRARLRRGPDGGVALDVADPDGAPVATVDALRMRAPAAPVPVGRPAPDGLHVVSWVPEPGVSDATPQTPDPIQHADRVRSSTSSTASPDRFVDVPTRGDGPATSIRETAAAALAVVQDHLASDDGRRLVVVTRRAVAAGPGERPDPAQAAVAGLVRAAAAEEPGRIALLDLDADPGTDLGEWRRSLTGRQECATADLAGPAASEVAVRGEDRLVPRWTRAADRDTLAAPDDGPCHLAITEKGSLDHLVLAPFPEADAPLEPGQVRIAVRAAGLNFRDVLNALGMYPGEAGALGSEAAGVVLESTVDRFTPGDRVFGLVPGAAGPRAVADARLVAPVPAGWTDAQAAGAPVVYLTAYRALVDLAAARPGERLLVHAAAGGVGLATLDLARHLGLEISGTASAGKQHLLRERGVSDERIASSRDLAFADRFGEVDIVLNALAGEFVDASLGLLADGGRFLEMGKTDVRDPATIRDGVTYTAFDMWDAGVERIAEMLAELAALFDADECAPLPTTAWDVADAREAFRYVSQARHVGKVVLTVPPTIGPDDLVVVTGGLGGLGAALARHLVAGGTRRLVLTGRRGADTPGAGELVAELAASGADVRALACDAADPDAVADLATVTGPPALIVHAAGVLDDGVVTAQDPERLAAVLRAKTDAVTTLDAGLAGPDTAMVVFSSVAGVLGAAGQSTYAAANAALDAWATARRREGAARWSLAWGPWGRSAGMTSGLSEADAARMARSGFVVLDPERGSALFDAARRRPEASLVPAPVDPAALAAAGEGIAPALSGLAAATTRRRSAASGTAGEQDLAGRLAALPADERAAAVLETVRSAAAGVLGHAGGADAVPADRDFRGLGFDSLTSVELRNRLSAAVGTRLPATLVFDHPTPRRLAEHLLATLDLAEAPTATRAAVPTTGTATGQDDDPIAIVGMGLRLPGGVRSPEDYWRLLAGGVDAVGPAPTDRGWEQAGPGGSDATAGIVGGFVTGAGDFDAGFFGIAPREALTMDPQQRLLLETAWEAIERAGIDPTRLRGSRTGVYAGTNYQGYGSAAHALPEGDEGPSMTGHAASVTSGRVAYALGLEGPAVTVDTACSSSSVALHWAASALRSGECDLALAGGVTVMATPGAFGEFAKQGGLAGDGRCKAFSDDADGTGWGEGAGLVLLERLSAARAAGHPVLAVVAGSAINSDGASNGLTAPNGPAQQRVIRDALAAGGVSAAEVDAVEAHGTGTALGDPIEAQALLATYGAAAREAPLLLGSVKTNIGHTQAAAGIAGIAKAVLALQHGVVPPTLHLGEPSSRVAWEDGAVSLVREATPLPATDRPHRIGVSSFGISGTNAHVVIESAPARSERGAPSLDSSGRGAPSLESDGEPAFRRGAPLDGSIERGAPSLETGALETSVPTAAPLAWPVSARDDDALADRARALLAGPAADADPARLAHALATTRTAFERRAVVVGRDRDELTAGLGALARGEEHPALVRTPADADPDDPGRLAFVFSGQGAQRVGMGADLLATQPVYAAAFDRVCAALDPHLPEPLRPVVLGEGSDPELVHRTEWTQPALFAVEVALVELVRSWGVRPDLVLGHSIGGLAAAHVAGVLDLDDAARLVAARGALMGEMPAGGAMAALEATEEEVAEAIAQVGGEIGIGAVNGPTAVVVSGDAAAVDAVEARFSDRGRRTRRLRVSHAFHSAHMDGMRERFAEVASSVTLAAPRVCVVSDLTGAPVTDELTDPGYWVRQVREPVRFGAGVDALLAAGATTILEIGPGASLTPLVAGIAGPDAAVSLTHRDDEALAVTRAAASLHVRGPLASLAPLTPPREGPDDEAVREIPVALPTYPFRRRRYWLDPAVPAGHDTGSAWDAAFWRAVEDDDLASVLPEDTGDVAGLLTTLARRRRRAAADAERDAWLHAEAWVPVPDPAPAAPTGTWTLVTDADTHRPLADALTAALRDGGAEVTERTAADLDGLAAGPVVTLLGHGALPTATGATTALVEVLRAATAAGAGPVRAVTRGAVVQPGTPDATAGAALWGLGRVAALEHPDVWGGLVDLAAAGDSDAGPDADRLLAVLDGGAGHDDQLALRSEGLLARRLRRVTAPTDTAPPDAGTPDLDRPVLITGGTGALGLRVARHLAGRGATHLVLVSRSGGNDEARALAAELDGVRVDCLACDVADPDAVATLIAGTGTPGVVVHAAGVLDDAPIEGLDGDRIGTVLAPKAALATLDAATRDADTLLVAFTSYAGVVGSPGQGNYAAGNALADAVIAARRAAGHPGVALAWGPWAGGGMAATSTTTPTTTEARGGVTPLDPEQALAVLDRLAGNPSAVAGTVLVADVDWDTVAAGVAALRPAPLLGELTDAAAGPADRDGAGPDLRATLAELRPADREERLVVEVRRVVARVLGHGGDGALEAVPAGRAFRDLGLDSLMAVDLRNRLAAATGLVLPPNLLFDHPTAAALGAHLAGELAAALGGGGEPSRGGRRSVLDELDRLESVLAGSRAGDDERRRIGDRLAALAATWAPAGSEPTTGAGHESDEADAGLGDASADEVFAFIDNDLGL